MTAIYLPSILEVPSCPIFFTAYRANANSCPLPYEDNACPFYRLFFCNYIHILLSNIFALIVVDETNFHTRIDSNLETFPYHISGKLNFYVAVFLLFQIRIYYISIFVS